MNHIKYNHFCDMIAKDLWVMVVYQKELQQHLKSQ